MKPPYVSAATAAAGVAAVGENWGGSGAAPGAIVETGTTWLIQLFQRPSKSNSMSSFIGSPWSTRVWADALGGRVSSGGWRVGPEVCKGDIPFILLSPADVAWCISSSESGGNGTAGPGRVVG